MHNTSVPGTDASLPKAGQSGSSTASLLHLSMFPTLSICQTHSYFPMPSSMTQPLTFLWVHPMTAWKGQKAFDILLLSLLKEGEVESASWRDANAPGPLSVQSTVQLISLGHKPGKLDTYARCLLAANCH